MKIKRMIAALTAVAMLWVSAMPTSVFAEKKDSYSFYLCGMLGREYYFEPTDDVNPAVSVTNDGQYTVVINTSGELTSSSFLFWLQSDVNIYDYGKTNGSNGITDGTIGVTIDAVQADGEKLLYYPSEKIMSTDNTSRNLRVNLYNPYADIWDLDFGSTLNVEERITVTFTVEGLFTEPEPEVTEPEDNTYGQLTYENYGDHIVITDCDESVTEVEIPDKIGGVPVTIIGSKAFQYCEELASVVIPEGVEEIGAYAFDMTALPDVTIPKSVRTIGEAAFYICEETNIRVLNPDCEIYPSERTLSSRYSYRDIPHVTIYGEEGSTAQEYAEAYGYHFIKFGFEPTDPVEGTDGRFNYLNYNDHIEITGPTGKGSSDIVIPETIEDRPVTEIGKKAFAGWNITSVVIPDSVTTLGEGAFYNCKKLKSVKIPAAVSTIPDYCFLNCESMTECDIPEGVTWIGEYAFENTGMATITLPSTLSYCYGWESFCYNEHLMEFVVAEGNEDYVSIDGVLVQKNYRTGEPEYVLVYPSGREGAYTIPEGLEVSSSAFAACRKLTSLTFPDSYNFEYFYMDFTNCNLLREVNVSETHPDMKSVDGVLYTKDGSEIVYVPYGRKGTFTIPDTVTTVCESAFRGNKGITAIIVPANVTEIEEYSFYMVEGLKSITFENPDCVIGGDKYTISNVYVGFTSVGYNGFIYGYEGSTAQAYAEKYGYNFGMLGSPTTVAGDCSNDGTFNLLDVVMLQRWILNDGTRLSNWKAVDFNDDGVLDVFDLALMKRALLNQ